MEERRKVLLVEDSWVQYVSLRTQFEEAGWHVTRAQDGDSTWREIEQAQQSYSPIDVVALDLGLPPGKDNPLKTGLPLVAALRQHYPTLPILAYTGLSPTVFDYALTLTKLLPLQVSFICLRPMSEKVELSNLLELAWHGFVLLSPVPADHLPEAIATKPDPLGESYWPTLKLLSEGLSQQEVANQLPNVGIHGVKAQVAKIKEILRDADELESYQTQIEDLVTWYRRHHVRYYRE